MRAAIRSIATAVALALPVPALADGDAWAGFYQAIDPEDGSTNHMSIVPKEGGGYVLQVSVTEHARCDAPAVIVAEGRLEDGQMIRENAVLRCEDADEIEHSDATYSLDEENGIVSLNAPFDGRTLFYHRISNF